MMYQRFHSVSRGVDLIWSIPYGFPNDIMDHRRKYGGPGSIRIRCTKFYKGCTKGTKMQPKTGNNHRSLLYGFLNGIMDHRLKILGLNSTRIRYTKFYKWCTKFIKRCTKFCEGCTMCSNMYPDMGNNLQSLPYGFLNEIIDYRWENRFSLCIWWNFIVSLVGRIRL